jgi:hypothetical protein
MTSPAFRVGQTTSAPFRDRSRQRERGAVWWYQHLYLAPAHDAAPRARAQCHIAQIVRHWCTGFAALWVAAFGLVKRSMNDE